MKTIGMLGGMSWESTVSYYKEINEGVRETMGGLHSAKIYLHSVDFDQIEKLQHNGDWPKTASILGEAAKSLELAGADFLMICTNTMHKVAPEIETQVSIPLLHIADATAKELSKKNIKKVGLLGTRFTMMEDFYKGRIQEGFGIEVIVPQTDHQTIVHDVIYNELCLGVIKEDSRNEFVSIINNLYESGAEAVILGCTEIALLIQQQHTPVPLFDTTKIHSQYAVSLALADG